MMFSSKRLLISSVIIISSYAPLLAQSNLMKEVTIGVQTKQTIAQLLEKIADQQHFSFAYNNKVVPADSLVSVSGYRGTLFSLLEKILGETYEFKEVPGYVVLRYAPRKLSIMAEVYKEQSGQTIIKGYVRDVSDQRPLAQASVYEKNLLWSALTDDRGYFELKLKEYTGSVMLTASKEDYRSTTLNLLPEVVFTNQKAGKKYTYYPDNAIGTDVEHNRFARFFIGSKQLLQGLNVGNFFASSPYQISLVPGLSTQGLYNSQVIDHLSLNLLGGYTAGIDGVELAGLFNINRKDMRFVQAAAIFNFVGGSTQGVQLAGVYNRVFNQSAGLQLAGLANINQQAAGVHVAGLINTAVGSRGVALAGLGNLARESSNIQIAGVLNKSAKVSLLQLSSVMNIAKKVKGMQIGLVNVADSSDYALGMVNLIKNGEKSISLSTDDSFYSQVGFRSGGRVLYGLIGFGYQQYSKKSRYSIEVGVGAHLISRQKFFLDTECVTTLFSGKGEKQQQTSSFRLLPGYKLNNHWGLFAGPAIQQTSAEKNNAFKTNAWILDRSNVNGHIHSLSSGISVGIRFSWF